MLYGKTIVITGVSSGIGARTAELALQLGADVIGIDRRVPEAKMESFIEGDLSTGAGVDEIVTHLPPRFDALCNVAGVSGTLGAAKTLAINFYGLRELSLAAAPRLREGGAIVSVASIAGYGWRANLERAKALVGVSGFPEKPDVAGNYVVNDAEGYPVSKEALLLWTLRAAHQDPFRARGIRVNAISPGPARISRCLRRCARRFRHFGGRKSGDRFRHSAYDSISLLGWRALDQRGQCACRRRPGGGGQRRNAWVLSSSRSP
jgi:NAD(P)-dependent dehydrogenase (short-subunit alcohol dehydrogenase family)